jgi:hypothetical protein
MKGPYERLKYDFRRVWECPACRHHELTDGTVTSVRCRCKEKEDIRNLIPMKLLVAEPRLAK